ncbi:glycosyltransferase family 2 protein [Pseudoduganella umbonata]|uniref:Glycosyltransferase family 2 protein n=1 Tax=Pseudoduganella umbonata TaxID=864828 RepID=A0A4P8HTF6_9BURK|nr:glycosyltransferase family 2 protein [Pseudoduganella umbonata]MBB3222340.1 glycosyltransferase involved in cell wall biosynthesis [Pseudoduganella umbonata]QCP12556.1 glycosyltransferase family 2 protein [Pseudoduganella umbonata]
MTEATTAAIDVIICTYRRPELLIKTLAGIGRCAVGLGKVRVIVVDNDAAQSAREVTLQWAATAPVVVTYLVQPQQNIALTRNMGLDHANAPWIALIDDDEVPEENWLKSLISTAQQYDADAVFAPVIAEFASNAPDWATKGTIFQRKRFSTGTVVPLKETRTGNVLLRGARLQQDQFRFDRELGLSGGEDSEFFARLGKAGYRMVWCDEACVREWTPPARTTMNWVLKRAFRAGSVEAYNKRRFSHFRQATLKALESAIFVIQGTVLSVCWAPVSLTHSALALRRAVYGVGYFYGLCAGPYLEYRAASPRKEIQP